MANAVAPRIAILAVHHPLLFRGGAQQSAHTLFQAIRQHYKDTLFIAANEIGRSGSRKADAYVSPTGLGQNEYLYFVDHYDYFWHRSESVYAKQELLTFLKEEKVTHVLLSHFMNFGIDMVPLLKERGIRVFVCFHEMLISCYADGHMVTRNGGELCTKSAPERCVQCFPDTPADLFAMRNICMRDCLDSAEGFIFPSVFLRDRLSDWGMPERPSHVIPHGIDRQSFGATSGIDFDAKTTVGRGEGVAPYRFGYFGQLVESKGIKVLFEAASLLERRKAGLFKILINGANLDIANEKFREYYRGFLRDCESWSYGSVIERGPYLHETLPFRMAEVDCIVVPSTWWEIYCLVLDEAKLFNRPVIASAIGGIPERVDPSNDGILVPPGDSLALARAMETLMSGNHSFKPSVDPAQSRASIAAKYLEAMGLAA
jgi:glycosyltransferase involved in cell wall biosynthesis